MTKERLTELKGRMKLIKDAHAFELREGSKEEAKRLKGEYDNLRLEKDALEWELEN